jgi:hypothetical protein
VAISKTDGSATISTTEYFMMAGSTTAGAGQTTDCIMQAFIDLENMVAGDRYEFTVYETVNATRKALARVEVDGARDKHVVFPSFIMMDGWDVSGKRLAGSDRVIKWSVRTTS